MQTLIALALLFALFATGGEPTLEGWVTHYDCPPFCGSMSNGDTYDPFGLTVAVDVSVYPELANRCLLVIADEEGVVFQHLFVTVTDSGHLYKHTGNWDVPVVLDFPEATFYLLAPMGSNGMAGIFRGKAWIVPDGLCPAADEDWWRIF